MGDPLTYYLSFLSKSLISFFKAAIALFSSAKSSMNTSKLTSSYASTRAFLAFNSCCAENIVITIPLRGMFILNYIVNYFVYIVNDCLYKNKK